jgi:DNA-binding transcriptional LysR family regulator
MQALQLSLPGFICAVQAAESGSFTAAAQVLNLTPAAVSKNIAALEAALQVRLFNRTTRQLSLTEEGKALVAQARLGLDALAEAQSLATQKLAPQGLVRVSCAVGFGRRYVLPALPAFFAAHPQVQIELSLNDQPIDLVQAGFDIGIRGGAEPPQGMVARRICAITAILVASPRYLAQHGTPQHFDELARHHLLKVKFLNGRVAPWVFKTRGGKRGTPSSTVALELPARLYLSDPEMMLDAALAHMGIARMGRHHAAQSLARGELQEVLSTQHVASDAQMAMFYPHRAGLAPRVRVVVDFLMAHFAAEPSLQAAARH